VSQADRRAGHIGLTGDVGAGKSRVLRWLAEQGAGVLDADEVVRSLLEGDEAVMASVRSRFGDAVVAAGTVDRAALAARVFRSPAELAALETILHPAVLKRVRAWLAAEGPPVRVVEAIKLIEGGLADWMDELWLVTCDRDERRRRLVERGWSAEEADRRMAAGPPPAPRLARADVVIDNSGPWPATERQLVRAWAAWDGSSQGGPDEILL
jgi:dephospho-CoA kinase